MAVSRNDVVMALRGVLCTVSARIIGGLATLVVGIFILWLLFSPDGLKATLVSAFGVADILALFAAFQALKDAASVPFYVTLIAVLVVAVLLRIRTGVWMFGRLAVVLGVVIWVLGIVAVTLMQSLDPATQELGTVICFVAGSGMVLLVIAYLMVLLAAACSWSPER